MSILDKLSRAWDAFTGQDQIERIRDNSAAKQFVSDEIMRMSAELTEIDLRDVKFERVKDVDGFYPEEKEHIAQTWGRAQPSIEALYSI